MRKLKIRKLRSGALQFVVFVSILIALLLSGLILYAYAFNYFKEQSKGAIQMVQQTNNALSFLERTNSYFPDTTHIETLENNNLITKMHTAPWGVFIKGTIITQHRKKSFKKICLLGGEVTLNKTPSLILQESYNPLVLVGNTKLEGNVILPSQGVKAGYIAGISFNGIQLTNGKVGVSPKTLPNILNINREHISNLLKTHTEEEMNSNYLLKNTITNSFNNQTLTIVSKNDIVVGNKMVIGNIILKSYKKIIISNTSKIKDILVVAPEIEIQENTTGNFQAIATTKITVGKNCKLLYPSALVIESNDFNNEYDNNNQIRIESKAQINGLIGYFDTQRLTSHHSPKILIQEQTKIKGQVYCNSALELKGSVSGSIITKEFVANQAGSNYINHIFNGTIDQNNLPNQYGGFLFENSLKKNCKWLY